ncbi:MAG: BNR repeat-containing protein [Candidatus Bathyarchaeota archaeon]|nr:BNR repeat-containing protein [Candidatus Bathyarchaeota archaeon]
MNKLNKKTLFLLTAVFSLAIFFSCITPTANATTWTAETVDPIRYTSQTQTSIAIDSNDNPHIVYRDYNNGDLKYAHWNGTTWDIETVDSTGQYANDCVIALDPDDNPHIVYDADSGGILKYAYWNGTLWNLDEIDADPYIRYDSYDMAVDAEGNPHISCYCSAYVFPPGITEYELRYATKSNSTWVIQTVDSAGTVGQYTSIAVDSLGNPHVSYYDVTHSNLKYARFDGATWHLETVGSPLGTVGQYTSLALDSTDNPHVAYYSYQEAAQKYAYWNGSVWVTETIGLGMSSGSICDIKIASDGNPHVVYYNNSAYNGLSYAHRNNTRWAVQTLNLGSHVYSTSISFELDSSDIPHISYMNNDFFIKYATTTATPSPDEVFAVTFSQMGVNPDFNGSVLAVDWVNYTLADLPVTLNWTVGSSHNYEYYPNLGIDSGSRYSWFRTSGMSTQRSGTYTPFEAGNDSILASYGKQYYVTLDNGGYGTTSGDGWYNEGDTANIYMITPVVQENEYVRHSFAGWIGSGPGAYTGPDYFTSITVYGPITETAQWKTQYKVIFDTSGFDSSVAATDLIVSYVPSRSNYTSYTLNIDMPCESWFDSGAPINYIYQDTVSSTTSGKRFELDLSVPSSVSSLTGPMTIVGYYRPQYQVTFSVSPSVGGAISPVGYNSWRDAGSLLVNATVNLGYEFGYWSVLGDAEVLDLADNYTAIIRGPCWITANFEENSSACPLATKDVTITSNPSGDGFIKVDGETITTPRTFTWNLNSNHIIEALSPVNVSDTTYLYTNWSNNNTQIHQITISQQTEDTITATYQIQTPFAVPEYTLGALLALAACFAALATYKHHKNHNKT